MRIIKHRQRIESVTYSRTFRYRDDPGAGFGFPCDSEGNVQLEHQAARDNYADCLAGKLDVVDLGIVPSTNVYHEPAIGECLCGHHVSLGAFTSTCSECGRDYNPAGQLLAPRAQWGEETGETPDEILAIGHEVS